MGNEISEKEKLSPTWLLNVYIYICNPLRHANEAGHFLYSSLIYSSFPNRLSAVVEDYN